MNKRILLLPALFLSWTLSLSAQRGISAEKAAFSGPTVDWSVSYAPALSDSVFRVEFSGKIRDGWHTYSLRDSLSPSTIEFFETEGLELAGPTLDSLSGKEFTIWQDVRLTGGNSGRLTGTISWRSCIGNDCRSPEDYAFSIDVVSQPAPSQDKGKAQSPLAALILEAILWGLAMLLTPCVFPMVPMTVSFFLKGSKDARQGRRRASLYGLFIVLLYTVPICLVIALTWLLGGAAVTSDIFNWLSTHWLPNIIFFLVFLAFALSFFGLFEITLPSKWTNSADGKASANGAGGIFFLALTLVLVSFSCTGPIVGTVLIKSTGGEFWVPMITMLAFSVAFALPFTLLALFPSLLGKLPKSGSWLGSVKIVLGFIEIALGLKFLSTADQTYHWGILPRPLYLGIWLACAVLLSLYLFGVLKIGDKLRRPTTFGKVLGALFAAFAIYLGSGFVGNPLRALSGYLPPSSVEILSQESCKTLEDAILQAEKQGKRVFVDITGYGCVNCREMDSKVLSLPGVSEILERDYIVVRLYTDDKTKLPEQQWVKTPEGKVLKDVGRLNSHIALRRFGTNSQPTYILLDSEGKQIGSPRGYNLDADAFVEFLKQ